MNNNTHQHYDEYALKWARCRAACIGQSAVHAGGEKFLPKLSGQTDAD